MATKMYLLCVNLYLLDWPNEVQPPLHESFDGIVVINFTKCY